MCGMNLLQTNHSEKHTQNVTYWYDILLLEPVRMRTNMITLSKNIVGSLTWHRKLFRFQKIQINKVVHKGLMFPCHVRFFYRYFQIQKKTPTCSSEKKKKTKLRFPTALLTANSTWEDAMVVGEPVFSNSPSSSWFFVEQAACHFLGRATIRVGETIFPIFGKFGKCNNSNYRNIGISNMFPSYFGNIIHQTFQVPKMEVLTYILCM